MGGAARGADNAARLVIARSLLRRALPILRDSLLASIEVNCELKRDADGEIVPRVETLDPMVRAEVEAELALVREIEDFAGLSPVAGTDWLTAVIAEGLPA